MKPALLTRYRVMAYGTGVLLVVLTVVTVLHYGFDIDAPGRSIIGIAHGWLYMAYLVTAYQLSAALRWPLGRMLLVMLAGTVPLASFFAERKAVEAVREHKPEAVPAAA